MMARTKRSRHSYGAGEWGRNRVRVFPDPKTGLLQIEWRENGRRLSKSLKHRDWARAKRQADEFAAGFAGPEIGGGAEAEPEPPTLETLFDIYGEEVTPTKGRQSRRHDRAAMRMFLGFFGRDRSPATLSQRDWDRFIRERRAGRVGPSGRPVSDRTIEQDLKLLLAILNWAAKSRDEQGRLLARFEPAAGSEDAQGEEPDPGRPRGGGIPGASRGVPPGRLAVSCRARARARDGSPHRCHPPASVVGHRHGRPSGAVARGAREVGLRTPDAGDHRGDRRLGRGAKEEPWDRRRACVTRARESFDVRALRAGALLVEESGEARGAGAEAPQRLALAEAEVRFGPHGPAAQGAVRAWGLEDGQNSAPVLPARRRGPAQERARQPPQSSGLNPISGNQLAGIRHVTLVSSMRAKGCTSATACPQGLRQLLF